MFSWIKNAEVVPLNDCDNVITSLSKAYKEKLLPLEKEYHFHDFHSPALGDADFSAKPMVMLVGQYSTGKTSFIKYLLERDFPGIHIGPEPTTDKFIAVMHGDQDGIVPGNALVVDPSKQFHPLTKYGNGFLNRFQCSNTNSDVLKSISILDTPGILSGEKQRLNRGYDFIEILRWFAERVDRILLLFDAHKLDISDEFRLAIQALQGHDEKIRIVLNKADMVDHQQLMRVYGALMWSLGKILNIPEVPRVYIGSFWNQPLVHTTNQQLFEAEQQDLFQDLQSLPRNAAIRKLNDLIKRARLVKVHAYIISSLQKQMPSMFGKDREKKNLIKALDATFSQIEREHNISRGDFPDLKKMQENLKLQDFTKFKSLNAGMITKVDKMLSEDIAKLMAMIPKEEVQARTEGKDQIDGGVFNAVKDQSSVFGHNRDRGVNAGIGEREWIVSKDQEKYDEIFEKLHHIDGKITGAVAKQELMKSKLQNNVLGKVWKLSDVDQDGMLDSEEFALAMHLINIKMEGNDLPQKLPEHLIPPSKR